MALKRQFNGLKGAEFPWVYEVAKDVVEGAFFNLATALKNYKTSKEGTRKGKKVGFPQFKSKKRSKLSFRLNNDRFAVDGHRIYLPKLGRVNMAEGLRFQGKIVGAVVSKAADWWYVSITVDVPQPEAVPFAKRSVGVDLGVKTLAMLSDGTQYENQALLRHDLNQLRQLCRRIARRKQGGNRWHKAKRMMARFYKRIQDQRADMIHKLTTEIAMTYRLIGTEDLHVQGMAQNRRLALSIADAAFGEIVRQLVYKAEWFGGQVVKVGRFFASSRICANCGYINRQLMLSDRTWTCVGCAVVHDRDENASKNIEAEALRMVEA